MNKQEVLKKLEVLIPDRDDFTGDMILCLNGKDNYPDVYQQTHLAYLPQMLGKINAFMTAQYTMQFVVAEQERAHATVLANCKPEDKEGIEEMLNLVRKKDEATSST